MNWCNSSGGGAAVTVDQPPVIAQSLCRLKSGRFEQIGMSWLKHGLLSTNSCANALWWATQFNFWFDADSPASGAHRLAFFEPSSAAFVNFSFPGIFSDGFEFADSAQGSATVP